jgi:hypothetical protein
MIFARVIFWIAGALGLAAIVPLYRAPGNATYYGLLATLIAWQCAFFVVGYNPVRFRPLMIPAVLEKVLWMITLSVLYSKGQVTRQSLIVNAATHGLLGLLFIVSFVVTAYSSRPDKI